MDNRITLDFTYQEEIERNSWPHLTAWLYMDIEKFGQEIGQLVWFEKGERAENRRAVRENIEIVVIASYLLFLFSR